MDVSQGVGGGGEGKKARVDAAFNYRRMESFPVRTEKLTGGGDGPGLVSHMRKSVCEHSPWAATVGTTEEGFWRGRLPRVAKESHIINMIIIKQFT